MSLESEVTPPELYFNRRNLLRGGIVAAGAAATGLLYRKLNGVDLVDTKTAALDGLVHPADAVASGFAVADPRVDALTPREKITNYNNFYEFTTNKDGVAAMAASFDTSGWKVEVGGLVGAPRTFDLDDLKKLAPAEERIYRMRCVEAWSMVIPWAGIPLRALIAAVQPTSAAKYVAFETLYDPKRLPGQASTILKWPYVEGLRLDEAMNPLALLATGLYGHAMPPQDGAPVRLVTPWKYGFKGIKSIVKITLVADMPPTSWNRFAASEYGFYGNVNPNHAHPRWSQATEQRIGDSGRRQTLMFNGYGDQVASLYTGMDLNVYY